MSEFEKWFMDQEFYTNMRFIHGDALFTKDDDVYRVLPVLIAFESWFASACTSIDHIHRLQHEKAKQQSEIDQLKAEKEKLEIELTRTKQVLNNVIDMERNKVDQLKAQLIEQGQWFNDQSQKVKDLEHWNLKLKAEKAGLAKLAKQWREESKELCRVDDKYVIGALLSCAERLEEAVRGGHE